MDLKLMIDIAVSFIPNILLICFIYFSALIFFKLIRFLFNYLNYLRLAIKYKPVPYKEPRKFFPTNFSNKNDFRRKDQKHELTEQTKKKNSTLNTTNHGYEIVGIAEPIGKWTKFVTSQKLNWLSAMVGAKVDSDQFWQNMIKAQQQAASKHKGRGGQSM